MNPEPTLPTSLLVHDGELADVRALLDEMGAPYAERRGDLSQEDRSADWGLVIASPNRMLRLHLDPTSCAQKIAVMSQDSRTLRNSLRRNGIGLLVRRPVHPVTLRALIVHALYRGPEKRRGMRVKIGAPVTYRAGWRQRPAILMDLSLGGCRILVDRRLERGSSFTLNLPADVAGGKAFGVKGQVLNVTTEPEETDAQFVTSARFASLGKRQVEMLRAAIAAHSDGPATFEGAPPLPGTPPAAPEPTVSARTASTVRIGSERNATTRVPSERNATTMMPSERNTTAQVPSAASPAVEPAPLTLAEAAVERRDLPRRSLDRRVVSLSEEAARVLMGRDITIGGMRVDRHPTLSVGIDVQLAVHTTTREQPLVVRAKVHRDDGERGMVLRFHALSPDATEYLNEVMDHLPLTDLDEADEGCLVTEILAAG